MATKAELQEQALQLEVDIYSGVGDDSKELTKAQLTEAIEAKLAANADAALAAEAEKGSARQSAAVADKAESDAQSVTDVAARSETTVDAAPELLEKMGLSAPSKADRALAKKHGYPVAVPGGKAYRTSVSFQCVMGGGFRTMGSIVILTDAHAKNKMQFLTAV